jgi:hypothetical protein
MREISVSQITLFQSDFWMGPQSFYFLDGADLNNPAALCEASTK